MSRSYFDYIPDEILCQIASELSNPDDIYHFMTTYERAEPVARECVKSILSDKQVDADFILQFTNLREVHVPNIVTKTPDEFLFLRSKLEKDPDNWSYYLGMPLGYEHMSNNMETPIEAYAFILGYNDDYIINMIEQRNNPETQEELAYYLLEHLIPSNYKSPLVTKLLGFIKSDDNLDEILEIAFETEDYEILNALYHRGYIITHAQIESVFNERVFKAVRFNNSLNYRLLRVIDYLVGNGRINVADLEPALWYYMYINNYRGVKYLVDLGVPIPQNMINEAEANENDINIINYLYEHNQE